MKNYEKIKKMTIDEMAEFLRDDCYHCRVPNCPVFNDIEEDTDENCIKNIKQWLESEGK